MWNYNYNNTLTHHGVKGMKWGVRKNRKPVHEDYAKAHSKKSVKQMSNEELKNRNNRLEAERKYKQLRQQTSAGRNAVNTFIKTAGTLTAIGSAYKMYKKTGGNIIDAVGDMIMADVVKAFNR